MYAVSSSATMAGLQKRGVQFVPDDGIDLRRPSRPQPVEIPPGPDHRDVEIAQLRADLTEAVYRVNRMMAWVREIEHTYGERCPVKNGQKIARIERRISRALGIGVRSIRSESRTRTVAFARQAVIYWALRLTAHSTPEIGRAMGGRDHTTVLHAAKVYPKKRAQMGRYLRPAR